MSERAATGPRDAIVVIKLSLDERDEVDAVVGFLLAGAAALEQMPVARSNVGEQNARRRLVAVGRRIAAEVDGEARRVYEERQAFYRAETKALVLRRRGRS